MKVGFQAVGNFKLFDDSFYTRFLFSEKVNRDVDGTAVEIDGGRFISIVSVLFVKLLIVIIIMLFLRRLYRR